MSEIRNHEYLFESDECKILPRRIGYFLMFLNALIWLCYSSITNNNIEIFIIIYMLEMFVVFLIMVFDFKFKTTIILYLLVGITTIILTSIYMLWYVGLCMGIFYALIILLNFNWCCNVQETFYQDIEQNNNISFEIQEDISITPQIKTEAIIVNQPVFGEKMIGIRQY